MVIEVATGTTGDVVEDVLGGVPDKWYGGGLKEGLYRQARGCLRKRPFATRRAAHLEAARIRRKNGSRLGAYHCPHCGKWHLTSDRSI